MSAEPPAAPSSNRFQEPGWFTRNVFNRAVAGMTALGVSVYGSRVLEVRGRKSGEWRQTPVNLLEVDGARYRWRRAATPSGSATCAPRAAVD
jgi:hypothetical protein